jgi:indolepyruvate ferredoxin oxidoreductase
MQPGHTRVVVNSAETPTAEFIKNPNWRFPGASAEADIRTAAGEIVALVDANRFAVALLGDAIYTNPFVLGFAWQRGWVPLRHESLVRAIELNAVQVEKNLAAFEWGRHAAHDLEGLTRFVKAQGRGGLSPGSEGGSKIIALHTPKALDALIEKRIAYLADYQNDAYAARYGRLVAEVRKAEATLGLGDGSYALTEAVAKNLHKLMAYKDEYEVARLYADPAFVERLKGSFEGDWKVKFHLAPPMLSKKDAHGHLIKKQYGPWVLSAMKVLAKMKFLRGTSFDIFGKTEERKMERTLITDYEALVKELIGGLTAEKLPLAIELANLPDSMRGYGHVKDNNVNAARVKWNALLTRWRGHEGSETRQVA